MWSQSAGWEKVAGCAVAPMLTTDTDVTKQDVHAWLFAWKGATVFQARTLRTRRVAGMCQGMGEQIFEC